MPRPNLGFSQRDPHTFGASVHDGTTPVRRGGEKDMGTGAQTIDSEDLLLYDVIKWSPSAGSALDLTLPDAGDVINDHNLATGDTFVVKVINIDGTNAGDLGPGTGWTEYDADNAWATAADGAILAKSITYIHCFVASATAITAWVESNVTST